MPLNSRFAVAAHILTLLYEGNGEPRTSEYIAGSVNTNAAVISLRSLGLSPQRNATETINRKSREPITVPMIDMPN